MTCYISQLDINEYIHKSSKYFPHVLDLEILFDMKSQRENVTWSFPKFTRQNNKILFSTVQYFSNKKNIKRGLILL